MGCRFEELFGPEGTEQQTEGARSCAPYDSRFSGA